MDNQRENEKDAVCEDLMNKLRITLIAVVMAGPLTASAQWLKYPTAGVPRTAAGSPHLTAPTPRTPDGKPDLSGLWGVM